MKTLISSFPSLGKVSVIDSTSIVFFVLLEVEDTSNDFDWCISLSYSDIETENWIEKPLSFVPNISDHLVAFPQIKTQLEFRRLLYTASLSIHHTSKFTIKFRNNLKQSWKSSRDILGIPDGVIVIKSKPYKDDPMSDLGRYIYGLNPGLEPKKCLGKNPNDLLWCLEAPIEAAEEGVSRIRDIELGAPWGENKVLRWMAIVRNETPWLAPRQGTNCFELDSEAVICSFLNYLGKHLILLAISGISDVTTLFTSNDKGNVVIRVRNDGAKSSLFRVIVGIGDDFESTITSVMDYATDMITDLTRRNTGWETNLDVTSKYNDLKKSSSEDWYDDLTFCTWNALGQRLTTEKIVSAVTSLAVNKINVTNFIIDDNWQSLDYKGNNQFQHGWIEFEADRNKFPKGLKYTVNCIREQQPSIKNVAIWHAILGYWGGLAPDGKLAKTYKTVEIVRTDTEEKHLPTNGKMTVVAKEDVTKFYDEFYRFLSSCGVNAVKTDVQSMLDTIVSAEARRDLITTYLDAWTLSAFNHFGLKVISCMSQTPQSLFYSHMPLNKPRFLIRNSDDFYPEIPASHPWHIFSNAHNSLFTRHLNCLPDWDMFQTVHNYSGYHAAARCVSGGPICITDVPGEHDFKLIDQITSLTPNGRTIILRPSMVGRSLDQYTKYDECKLLQIGTSHGEIGIIGCFNISQEYCSELIPLSNFPAVKNGIQYIVRVHSTGIISKPLQTSDPNTLLCVSLGTRGFDIISAFPLTKIFNKNKDEEISIAILGLLGKMTGAAAVVKTRTLQLKNEIILIEICLKALGILGIFMSSPINSVTKRSINASILGIKLPADTIKVNEVDAHVIEIDVAKAWQQLRLRSGEENEVEIKVEIG
ncbi:putative galactinol--sucrose galactosyltransferase 6 [Erysiphe neolycopersici]|uniref:Putative galactinol--sucrose galactosyltransferase 6 n=1 Tax=Erysiphe neolycopersici TaxID=212602 RepID=A0A420HX39_9PEZI|nr:putative galactinol--sucrose galactosyltransferase 6 [Erysiphe neolycopersici]